MSVKTNNIYGKITISNSTIEHFVARTALDCYGIVKFVPINLLDAIKSFVSFGADTKGVKVKSTGDRMAISVSVVVKYGVSIRAVVEALKESIKYKVEKFTGMIVDVINVRVESIQR